MPTSGTISGTIAIALGILALIAAVILIIHWTRRDGDSYYDDRELSAFLGFGLALASLPLLIIPVVGFSLVAWNGDYMAYHPVSGKVEQVASRQISDGKGMSQRYVVTVAGQPYGVDDTRAALLKPGDEVSLNCVREFVWGSTNNGYACNWG